MAVNGTGMTLPAPPIGTCSQYLRQLHPRAEDFLDGFRCLVTNEFCVDTGTWAA